MLLGMVLSRGGSTVGLDSMIHAVEMVHRRYRAITGLRDDACGVQRRRGAKHWQISNARRLLSVGVLPATGRSATLSTIQRRRRAMGWPCDGAERYWRCRRASDWPCNDAKRRGYAWEPELEGHDQAHIPHRKVENRIRHKEGSVKSTLTYEVSWLG